jgi:hypothetical protein
MDEQHLAELEQLLYWRWDPIGVSESFPSATDEYGDYARDLTRLLRAGAGVDTIAEYLRFVEDEWIQLPTSSEARVDVARRILLWSNGGLPFCPLSAAPRRRLPGLSG